MSRVRQSNEQRGFTLLELVLAVAILGGSLLTLLFLRTSAVERAAAYNRDREIQRLAQEKLDEVVFELEEEVEGNFEEQLHPDWFWSVEVVSLSQDGPELLECQITVTYPDSSNPEGGQYTFSSWVFPDEESLLLQLVADDSGEGSR